MISARGISVIPLFLAVAGCASAASAARISVRPLPLTVRSQELTVSVSARNLTASSVDVVVLLAARRILPDVQLRVHSPDGRVAITRGCALRPLNPPRTGHAGRSHPNPLSMVPLCSIVVHAAQSGRYPLNLRIVDAAGHDLVTPIHTMIRVPGRPH